MEKWRKAYQDEDEVAEKCIAIQVERRVATEVARRK